ncbi:hypothetical protein CNMCM5793_001015 [Aspergillus hiratsukae]|uniref:Uncharacterized protein n=1 Tax=Aspergillus hiratsukae TaxID=1194566 RepID=A0A8H6PAM5_9EURO|nr:hypothetical protein CNMCM5793_001015 [Aspergillus hiratsukae]KAF7163807.1 hypothetical protein CNMCM6106_000570 [Aspergillus hiratsukae]
MSSHGASAYMSYLYRLPGDPLAAPLSRPLDHVLKPPRSRHMADVEPVQIHIRNPPLHLVRNGRLAANRTGPSPPIDAFSATTRGVHRGMSLLVVVDASRIIEIRPASIESTAVIPWLSGIRKHGRRNRARVTPLLRRLPANPIHFGPQHRGKWLETKVASARCPPERERTSAARMGRQGAASRACIDVRVDRRVWVTVSEAQTPSQSVLSSAVVVINRNTIDIANLYSTRRNGRYEVFRQSDSPLSHSIRDLLEWLLP